MVYKSYEEFVLAIIDNEGVCPHVNLKDEDDIPRRTCKLRYVLMAECDMITCPILSDIRSYNE